MKTHFFKLVFILLLSSGFIAISQKKSMTHDATTEFLTKIADSRLMAIKAGNTAANKAASPAIREYAVQLVKDQTTLLDEIKILAAKRNIILPATVTPQKEKGRENLSKKQGKDFDDAFIKTIAIDQRTDVRLFKNAIEFKDREVSDFARKYLPLVQAHLAKTTSFKPKR